MIKNSGICDLPFQRIKISSEGSVSMCCFQERGCLGNILHTSLEDIWNSQLAKEIRQETLAGRLHKVCQIVSCPLFHLHNPPSQTVELQELPIDWEIDLPNQHCNIGGEKPTTSNPACLMCERHLFWFPQLDCLHEICKRLKPYNTHLRSLHIQGVAESFWKDRIFEILEWLDIQPGQEQVVISTTTNGTIFTEPRRRRFLKHPRSVLTFSVDAATPETYKLIRRVDLFHRVKENFLAYSRERNPEKQDLRIHNNINLLNIHEVEQMVELAAQANCPIDFNPTYAAPLICVDKDNAYLFHAAEQKIKQRAEELGVKVTFMRNLALDFDPVPLPTGSVVSLRKVVQAAEILAIPVANLIHAKPEEIDLRIPVL
jgi:hypothetical protein